ncbi:MAG: MFS transporter [Byssovorax sp.]
MFSRISDRNIWVVYGAILLLGLGYGSALSVLAVFLGNRGFGKTEIGLLGTAFGLGLICFSLPMGALIRRFSARATLIASLVVYIGAVVVFPFLDSLRAMALVRFLDGASSVGVWVCCETILLSRAERQNKAFVTSLYALSLALGYILGPFGAKLIVALLPMRAVFFAAGGLAVLALLLVLLRLDPDKAGGEGGEGEAPAADAGATKTSALAIFAQVKTSCFATFSYGYFQAAVVLFLPPYLIEQKGVTEGQTILVPAFFAAGMLGFANFAGRLGDRHGHLFVMRLLALVGAVMILGFVYLGSYAVMCGAVFIAGASLASISPVSLALQGVIVRHEDLSRANAIYNAFYAAGILLGPAISSILFKRWGGPTMLWHFAILWAVFIAFTLIFAGDDPARRKAGDTTR